MPVQGSRSLRRGIEGAVGETPMVELQRLPPPGSARVLALLDSTLIDRTIAVDDAEARGDLLADSGERYLGEFR